MWRLFPILFLFNTSIVRADITHSLSTSTMLTVNGAATISERIGSSYSSSGSNITASTFGGLTAASGDNALINSPTMTDATYVLTVAGSAYSFSESFTPGDSVAVIGSGVDVASGVVADMPAFGKVTTQSGGVPGNLGGTLTSQGVLTLTPGSAGTSVTGQFISEITVK